MNNKKHQFLQSKKEKALNVIKEYLYQKQSILFAFLHGSFLEDMPFQDIDVAVYYDEDLHSEERINSSLLASAQLSTALHIPVDVHALNGSAVGFCYEVTKGEVLFSRDEEKRFDFMEKIWAQYFDLKPVLEQTLADLLE